MGNADIRLSEELDKWLAQSAGNNSFFQIVETLHNLCQWRKLVGGDSYNIQKILLMTNLSLGTSNREVNTVTIPSAGSSDAYIVTVNILGLYGTNSPLPNHFTERLLQLESDSLIKVLIDTINHSLLRQLYLINRNRQVEYLKVSKTRNLIKEKKYAGLTKIFDHLPETITNENQIIDRIRRDIGDYSVRITTNRVQSELSGCLKENNHIFQQTLGETCVIGCVPPTIVSVNIVIEGVEYTEYVKILERFGGVIILREYFECILLPNVAFKVRFGISPMRRDKLKIMVKDGVMLGVNSWLIADDSDLFGIKDISVVANY